MKIRFLGASREVGRSSILLEGKKKIMLDCGVKIGNGDAFPLIDKRIVNTLDEVVLSHAHLDHSGFLPVLYRMGYRKKVLMTKPTRDLIQLLLADYLKIASERHAAPFSQKDLNTLLTHVDIVEYEQEKNGITFYDAGHILGSAIIVVKDSGHKVIYTGDLNTKASRLLEGAKMGLAGDTLIIESTYGSKKDRHTPVKEASAALIASINETLRHGGKVIIPTFAIGRGQEILYTLENYLRSKQLHETPIYLDGMIKKALRIYRHNAINLKREVQYRILTSDDDPFKSDFYKIPETKSREDVFEQPTAIILTTSGMLNGGPVLHYLKKLAPDARNKVILVGFQAQGTRGRLLLEGADELEIDGEKVAINAALDQAPFSAHSDYAELMEFVSSIKGLKRIFVVHGEEEKSEEFASELRKKFKRVQVTVPENSKEYAV